METVVDAKKVSHLAGMTGRWCRDILMLTLWIWLDLFVDFLTHADEDLPVMDRSGLSNRSEEQTTKRNVIRHAC